MLQTQQNQQFFLWFEVNDDIEILEILVFFWFYGFSKWYYLKRNRVHDCVDPLI